MRRGGTQFYFQDLFVLTGMYALVQNQPDKYKFNFKFVFVALDQSALWAQKKKGPNKF